MKKNIITAAFAAASALLLVSSCAKEQLSENISTGDGKVFSAVISQDLSRTTITSENQVNWEQGDLIDISGGTTYSATPDASDATRATFTKVSGPDPTPDYIAVYPASIFKNGRHELPAIQTYAAGKFNAPMCAISETESLEFKNFCGVLCLSLKGTGKVKSIAVTANEQLCGSFEFADATSISFNGEVEGYTVTLDCGEGVQLDASTATNFYISLPPATYTSGMKIVINNTEGKTIEKTTTKSAAIARNKIYTFNWTATFAPTIVSVQLWKDGPYFATCNVGAEKPEDAGYYFWWGDIVGYRHDGEKWVSADGKGTSIKFSNESPANTLFGKEVAALADYLDDNGNLKSDYDAATAHLGEPWRMMTKAELDELVKCPHTPINTEGTEFKNNGDTFAGYRVSGKGEYSANSIFLPAAGNGDGSSLKGSGSGSYGRYWSSTPSSDSRFAWRLGFNSSSFKKLDDYRYYGFSVRPVKDAK